MNDLDFDELDKAVSSLMGKTQSKKDQDEPGQSTSEIDNSANTGNSAPVVDDKNTDTMSTTTGEDDSPIAQPLANPDDDKVDEIIEQREEDTDGGLDRTKPDDNSQATSEASSESKLSVPHRAGRFMDVKHDSSSMRSTSTPSIKRQGNTIEPLTSNSKLEGDDRSMAQNKESEKSLESDDKPSDKEQVSEPLEVPTSPFLTDAKVEKRPLGRSGKVAKKDEAKADDNKEPDVPDTMEEPAEATTEDPVELPEELQPDLVSIEAGVDTEASPELSEESASVESVDRKPKVDLSSELKTEEGKPVADKKPTGPVSIAQQYKESPSSQPEKNGTIYDTENYHQPIAHPAKKKSGWMVVVWILLIVLLGCSLGVAAYFSGLV